MILLDTNIASEFSKRAPNLRIAEWLEQHDRREVFLSAISIAEMRAGVAILPEGAKKAALTTFTNRIIAEFGSALPFDALAAGEYAEIIAERRRQGRPMSVLDTQIAAIARSGGFTLATLNVKDFEGLQGLKLVDPSA